MCCTGTAGRKSLCCATGTFIAACPLSNKSQLFILACQKFWNCGEKPTLSAGTPWMPARLLVQQWGWENCGGVTWIFKMTTLRRVLPTGGPRSWQAPGCTVSFGALTVCVLVAAPLYPEWDLAPPGRKAAGSSLRFCGQNHRNVTIYYVITEYFWQHFQL